MKNKPKTIVPTIILLWLFMACSFGYAGTLDDVKETESESLKFHGYLRSGFGINGRGGDMVAFQAPGADSKYRLGNEIETYGEAGVMKYFTPGDDNPFFKMDMLLAYSTKENKSWDPDNDQFSIRESYAQAGSFEWAPGVSFWAGQRFYRRHDINIIDYYYLDMSGYGGGVEDVKLGNFSKLAVAYIGGSMDNYEFPKTGRVAKNTIDIRFYDIKVPLGSGMIWIAPSALTGGTYQDEDNNTRQYDSAHGIAGGFLHTTDSVFGFEGSNNLCVQYGTGTGSDFSPNVQDPDPELKNRKTFRIAECALLQPNERFAMMYSLVYKTYDNGLGNNSMLRWFSTGLRPIIFFNKHVALAVEAGLDRVDSEPGDYSGSLFKLTIAPELRFDNTFFGRPVLRAFVTGASWTDGFKGKVGGTAYEDATSGFTVGLQMESSW